MRRLFLLAAVLTLLADSSLRAGKESPGQYSVVIVGTARDVRVQLRHRPRISIADREWLHLDIVNLSRRPVVISGITCDIRGRCFDLTSRRETRNADLVRGNMHDLFPGTDPSAQKPLVVPAGRYVSTSLSHQCTSRLGLESITNQRVLATAGVRLEVDGQVVIGAARDQLTHSVSTPFVFDWLAPDAADIASMQSEVRLQLANPGGPVEDLLIPLLRLPEVAAAFGVRDFVAALSQRPTWQNRDALLMFHINEHHSDAPEVHAWFLERLNSGESDVLIELLRSPNIRDASFVMPTVRLMESSTEPRSLRQGLALLESLEAPQQKDQQLARRLSAAVRGKSPLWTLEQLQEAAQTGRDYEYQSQISRVARLGQTRDRRLIPVLVPWLDCNLTEDDERGTMLPSRYEDYPPMRISEAALQAILQIEGGESWEIYQSLAGRIHRDLLESDIESAQRTNAFVTTMTRTRADMIASLKRRLRRVRQQ